MVLTRKLTWAQAAFYWAGQFAGAALGGLIIYAIANNIEGFSSKNNFAANGWDKYSPGGYGIVAAMFVEVVFTALLVYVVLATTSRHFPIGFGGLAAGIALALIHMVTIPVDNTSVNPGPQLRFSALRRTRRPRSAVAVHGVPADRRRGRCAHLDHALDEARLEDTLFAEVPGATEVRDTVEKLDDKLDATTEDVDLSGVGPGGDETMRGPIGLTRAVSSSWRCSSAARWCARPSSTAAMRSV